MNGLEKLNDQLKKDIERFDRESTKHKSMHRRCQTAVIALTALTTITAGTGLIVPIEAVPALQFVVLCLTSTAAALTAWSEMRRTRDLWQHEREVYYALVDIRRELEFHSALRELTQDELNRYFKRMATVLGSSTQKWVHIQEKQSTSQ